MLVLFAFSITPKKTLHDLVTNHRDTHIKLANPTQDLVAKAGFNCPVENLVAESAFTNQDNHFEFVQLTLFPGKQGSTLYSFYSTPRFFFGLRGPPAVC